MIKNNLKMIIVKLIFLMILPAIVLAKESGEKNMDNKINMTLKYGMIIIIL